MHSLIIHLNGEEHACFIAHGDGTYLYLMLHLEDLCKTQIHVSELQTIGMEYQLYKDQLFYLKGCSNYEASGDTGISGRRGQCCSVHVCRKAVMDSSSWKRIPDHIAARTI